MAWNYRVDDDEEAVWEVFPLRSEGVGDTSTDLTSKKSALSGVPSLSGQSGSGKNIGHHGVDALGEMTHKKTTLSTLKCAIQLGKGYRIGNLSSKPDEMS
ncbi:hypothetical protein NDU88_005103 [Pleurodeles waltl]|uniref:Uncharacterized protein n=1 Tax=Pleurodeles waltl TaxID=8319 RepID=A0AAV7WBS4_PLEWA|nr:hypothetical protein NDU88_005103 [Pleurodeles waltl]